MLDEREADRLAMRARRGDSAAVTQLYLAHAPALLSYLQRLLGRREAAHDVLQETFLQLIEGRGRYRPRGRFRSWLFSVASNCARDFHRRENSRHRLVEAVAAKQDPLAIHPEPAAEDALHTRETLAQIERALEDLPRSYAAAFHLRVREEFSYREMAAITGESEGTLRSRVHHTLRRLRAHLNSNDGSQAAPPDAFERNEP
jgi:RNA polymerase sigma-70 factor (ECF subfamily)